MAQRAIKNELNLMCTQRKVKGICEETPTWHHYFTGVVMP